MSISPNPVLSSGEIRLAIPSNDRVSVKVYDVNGKYVETLMDKEVQAGAHQVTWEGRNKDGRRVTPGIYFVRVETTRGSLTKKMVLSR
jgi:flagellar hook assembly protein FlgD